MKHLIRTIIIIAIFNLQYSICNSQTLSPQVFATNGGYSTGGGNSLSWTMGETFNTTLTSGTNMLTQGEQQPYIYVKLINLKAYLQGYYSGGGMMRSVLQNQNVSGATSLQTDNITVELHDAVTPATVVESATSVLNTNGTAFVNFSSALAGKSYWIAIIHRNSIETWSESPVLLDVITSYDFSTARTKAYNGTMIDALSDGTWSLYTGDLNQDGFIDANDYPDFDNDNFNSVQNVYVSTDMNGDGFVDANDYPIFDNNNFNSVQSSHP